MEWGRFWERGRGGGGDGWVLIRKVVSGDLGGMCDREESCMMAELGLAEFLITKCSEDWREWVAKASDTIFLDQALLIQDRVC